MNPTVVFLGDLTLAIVVCAGTVLYLARHLRLLLIELCGTAERANFWLAFSNVSLVVSANFRAGLPGAGVWS